MQLAKLDCKEQQSYNESPRSRQGTTNKMSNKLEPQNGISSHSGVYNDIAKNTVDFEDEDELNTTGGSLVSAPYDHK